MITPTATTTRKTSSDMQETFDQSCSSDRRTLGLRRLPIHGVPIRLASRFHGIGQVLALATERFLPLIDPLRGGLSYIRTALLQIVRAFAGFVLQHLARFIAGFRREQHADPDA